MLSRLVLPPLGKLRLGLTGHVGVVIGGVEQQAIGGWRLDLPDALEKLAGNRVEIGFGHPIPFFPVALAGEFVEIDGPGNKFGLAIDPGCIRNSCCSVCGETPSNYANPAGATAESCES